MLFKKPTPTDYQIYKKWLFNGGVSCENSYLNAFMWQEEWNYEYAIFNDSLTIRLFEDGKYIYFLPLGNSFEDALEEILKTEKHSYFFAASEGKRFEKIKALFGDEYSYIPVEENFEYIYDREDLENLSGKKYHQKRNHISAFMRKYNWRFEKLTNENVCDALAVEEKWLAERDDENGEYKTEREAIEKALKFIDELEILGGILYVDDNPVAFTFGSAINDEVFDVNIEKALLEYNGAYAMINNQFVKNCLSKYKLINREDDLGIEGLRKAKLSYRPVQILKKYAIAKK